MNIYKFVNKSLDDLTYKMYDVANNFNRQKFEATCLKNRLKKKIRKNDKR